MPAGPTTEVATVVGNMFLTFPSVRMDLAQTKAVTVAYVAQLKHLPLWAIETGCKSCISRDLAFPPSAGELRAACERAVQPVRDEEAALRKVLDAEVYHSAPASERQRVIKGFAELTAEIREANGMAGGKVAPAFTRPVYGTPTSLSEEAAAKFHAKYPNPEPRAEDFA